MSVFQNVGATETNGVEFGINAVILDNPDGLNFDVSFNISSYDEKITELALTDENGNPMDDVGNGGLLVSRWSIYNYQYGGIYQVSEASLTQSLEGKSLVKLEELMLMRRSYYSR